jgi:hypothetical protein
MYCPTIELAFGIKEKINLKRKKALKIKSIIKFNKQISKQKQP